LGGSFHHDRQRLIDEVGRQTSQVVETYDKEREAQALAESAQTAVAALAATEVGAIGLGALIAVLATTVAADITGVLLASVVAALGLFILPSRRRKAKAEMREKIGVLRDELSGSLRNQFEQELERSLQRIQEAIAPYTRFVRAEQGKLTEAHAEMDQISREISRLEHKVNEL
jgi:hypothetical protein